MEHEKNKHSVSNKSIFFIVYCFKEVKFTKKILQKCEQSNCIIAIFMKRDPKESVPEWEEIAATAMAVQNIWLTCVEYEIGCYWTTPKYIDKMNDFFMLKENERCLGFFYMGKYDHSELESKERESIYVKTEWNF